MPRRLKERETSPERTKVWIEPPNTKIRSSDRKVPVIYYLCRSGQLEHPHFMEVPLSSSHGLHLTDVINRLNFLRGNGMASMYSWSCKRSYKNGYVWHDLSDNDFVYPAQGQEYVLKGSEIVEGGALMTKSDETVTSPSYNKLPVESKKVESDREFPTAAVARRRNQTWSAFDFHEYKVYTGENPGRAAANASTQTDDKRRCRRPVREIEEIEEDEDEVKSKELPMGNSSSEMSTDEISPPPSDSSPETLETLMKADGRIIVRPENANEDQHVRVNQMSERSGALTVLMRLLSCGSIGFSDCRPSYTKGTGISLGSHQKVPRGEESGCSEDDTVKVEAKEYFSGSLIETTKKKFPVLKRSSSYNADRRVIV